MKQQEILIQNFFNSQWNNLIEADEIFIQKIQHLINNALKFNFRQNKLKNNLIDPLQNSQQKLLVGNKNDLDLLMYVLACQFQMTGQKLYQTKRYDQLNILSLQASFGYGLDYTTCLQLTIQNNEEISYQQLQDNKNFKRLKELLAYILDINPENISFLQIEEGSIKVSFIITNEAGVKEQIDWEDSIELIEQIYPDAQLVLHQYFQEIQLSYEDFDPQYNMEWNQNQNRFESRGPYNDKIKYFFPKGWKGYALKVKGKYDGGNDDWLEMDGNSNEWHIMYHGTKQGCVKGILQNGFLTNGRGQKYRNQTDIRLKQRIGDGVYFSNHIEVAEQYTDPIKIGDYIYKVVFQSRVRPQSLKQIKKDSDIIDKRGNTDWNNDYFVVNKAEDIRPYRILLKKEKYIQQLQQVGQKVGQNAGQIVGQRASQRVGQRVGQRVNQRVVQKVNQQVNLLNPTPKKKRRKCVIF